MKRILFFCAILTALFASCGQQSKQETPVKNEKKSEHAQLLNEGWSELCEVRGYEVDVTVDDEYFLKENSTPYIIYMKGQHYIALDRLYAHSIANNYNATRYSVSKGNFRKVGKTFTGRISAGHRDIYFNF